MVIDAGSLGYREVNEALRRGGPEAVVNGCTGQRFIAAGASDIKVTLNGTPGNALGAYLNGAEIVVNGSAQDAVGDTMNEGRIVVGGNIGDACGYAMRGGSIFVKGNAGYRAGIHMKAYENKVPLMVIGGFAGSFLGEYQAGGVIVVLGLGIGDKRIVGNFPCTGMHGGKMFLRGNCDGILFPDQVSVRKADETDLKEISGYVSDFCTLFGSDFDEIMDSEFVAVTPDTKNPYKRLYVAN